MIIDAFIDTLIDSIKLVPFLFLTYLFIEYLEHKASKKTVGWVLRAGNMGPLFGGLLGVIPQCGFSAAGSNLYSGRIISLGTLLAIYLSTSDEMLPVLLSKKADAILIIKILLLKILIATVVGFLIDFIYYLLKKPVHMHYRIENMCEHEHCGCNEGNNIIKSAIIHTLQIFGFIFAISLLLNIVIGTVGSDTLFNILKDKSVLSVFLSALIGLIPNCASSVVITELFIEGFLSFGAMMAGLLVGAGVGILVLFRVNDDVLDSLKVVGILYLVGVLAGLALLLF